MGVANSIITRHGGKIEVESEEGTGTSITLNLPVKSEIEQQEPAAAPAWGLMAKGLRVLVVDDKEEMCNILDTFFSRAGHIVKVAGNGAEAIESAKREDFDLVICDLTMPGVTGYDVIMALNKLGKVPKIGLATGSGEKLTSIEESALKVDFIINKPFRLLELASKVNALFNDV
jgi:CheY-like chemotaxis protein